MRDGGGGGQEVRWATEGNEICLLNGKIQLRHPPARNHLATAPADAPLPPPQQFALE